MIKRNIFPAVLVSLMFCPTGLLADSQSDNTATEKAAIREWVWPAS